MMRKLDGRVVVYTRRHHEVRPILERAWPDLPVDYVFGAEFFAQAIPGAEILSTYKFPSSPSPSMGEGMGEGDQDTSVVLRALARSHERAGGGPGGASGSPSSCGGMAGQEIGGGCDGG